MNKFQRVLVAILGGVNTMFSIFLPIGLTLLLVPLVSGWHQTALIAIGILSSLYRAIDIGFLVR